MRAITKMTRKKGTEFMFGKMEQFTKEISQMISGMGMEKCTGPMAKYLRANGWTTSKEVEVIFI